ncbi:MAG: glycosyltransferase [Pirellulales bacterium]
MVAQLVTIAVVPHERFSAAKRSLDGVLAHREPSTDLVYIDGGSPPLVRQYLEQQAARRDFRLISTEKYVAPNVARNLAAALVRTKYVAFVDNDVLVSPGWLERLVGCAESTGAWVVGPLCCEREPAATRIHAAGGVAEIVASGGRRACRESHRHRGRLLAQIGPALAREAVGQIDFHAALLRMDVFARLGPLDERLVSALEHTDLCLSARGCGGEVYLEPSSVVTYLPPPPFDACDLEYFQIRWSDAWNRATLARFREKWELAEDDPGLQALAERLADHRRLTLEPYRRVLRLFGRKPARWVEKVLIAPLELAANRRKIPAAPHAAGQPSRRAA